MKMYLTRQNYCEREQRRVSVCRMIRKGFIAFTPVLPQKFGLYCAEVGISHLRTVTYYSRSHVS